MFLGIVITIFIVFYAILDPIAQKIILRVYGQTVSARRYLRFQNPNENFSLFCVSTFTLSPFQVSSYYFPFLKCYIC